jgi:sugar transferase EpsL
LDWKKLKRFFDFVASLFGLLLLLPVVLVIALLIRLKIGSPIFFKQLRPGMNKKLFYIYKFRSMTNKYDKNGNLLPDKERLSNFGKFLRSTSLDELPGLWSVLKGDMSLVGPRPLLIEYLPLYSKKHSKRHDLRPGITGWAQVNGRNSISWKKKLDFDIWYVENQSFWLDIKILGMTFRKVILREGVSQKNHVTADKFRGSL